MQIKFNDKPVLSFEDWREEFVSSKKSGKDKLQWKEGRSACTLARFIMLHDGQTTLEKSVSAMIGCTVTFHEAVVEHVIEFDNFPRGSHRDLTLSGETEEGKSVFVTVEAKVDEPFDGRTIRDYYASGDKPNSKQRPRLDMLCQRITGENYHGISDKGLMYQLFHSTVATVDGFVDADYHIMMIIVFKTECADDNRIAKNHDDYMRFLYEIGAEKEETEGLECHKISIFDRDFKDKKAVRLSYTTINASMWQ